MSIVRNLECPADIPARVSQMYGYFASNAPNQVVTNPFRPTHLRPGLTGLHGRYWAMPRTYARMPI